VIHRRVAITGIGVFCAAGRNVAEFWESLLACRPGIAPLEGFTGLKMQHAAQVRGYRPEEYLSTREIDLLDPFAQFALIAAREAVRDSGIEWTDELRQASGVITGSCVGGKRTEDDGFVEIYAKGKTRLPPMVVPRTMANAGASMITMEYRLTGPSFTYSTACASSNHAIGQAFWMIRQGQLEMAIAGGSEAPFTMGHLRAWEALRVVAPDTCRPFSIDRKGMILGEGGAMLVLEPLDAAIARGARVYGEVVGAGMSADAHHITQPSPVGAARAMRMALQDAGLAPEAVGYINAHGTGTLANDSVEAQAIHAVFGAHAKQIAVSSTKSLHGHTLGAAGAVEGIAAVLGLQAGLIPPTANFTTLDPQCDLDVVAGTPRETTARYALSNSFAFGGLNAVVAFAAPSAPTTEG
jgi:nodulation protein E